MNRGKRNCEICGIQEKRCSGKVFFAKFPLREHICKQWVKVVGKEDLVHLPIEKLHDLKHICGRHFDKRHFTKTNTRLKKHAEPTLQLTMPPLPDELLEGFPLHMAGKNKGPAPAPVCSGVATVELASTSKTVFAAATTQTIPGPAPAPVCSDVATVELASTSKTLFAAETIQTVPGPAPAPVCSGVATVELASTSKTLFAAATTQTIPDPSITSTNAPAAVICAENEGKTTNIAESATVTVGHKTSTVPVVQKTRKRPLTTSNILNIKDPAMPSTSAFIQPENVAKKMRLSEADLNTRERELLHQLRKTKATVKSLKKSATLIDSLESTVLKEIVNMILKNQKRKFRGRRWTTQSKISLLAIFKRSPKAYRYLRHLMPLPSESTLTSILKKIPMEPGLCRPALEHLKKHLPKNVQDKHCCLLFDEIALKPRLIHNNTTDKIEGFADMGNGERSPAQANHALVFMLQGLKTKYKQPIAFYFVKGTVSSQKLATLIKDIIKSVNETGFNVVSTICDQGPTNTGALNILKQFPQTNKDEVEIKNYFTVGDKKIYIVYDVPHLFKSVRNNFMNNGAMKMGGDTAKWEHLLKVEERNRNLLYLSKISPTHVQPKYRAKMKVKYAAQILSNTVYAVLMLLAPVQQDPAKIEEFKQTARVVLQLDRLFDYTNGPSGPDDVKRGKRENVSAKTDHLKVWAEYRKLLETVSFIKPGTGIKAKNVRCIEGYKTTLCSLRDIWTDWQRLGFKYLNLRQLNQDALENLFGVLRQHSPTNRNPTVASFIAAIKTAIVSKMTAPQSRGTNCERDTNKLLTDFHDIVFDKTVTTSYTSTDEKTEQTANTTIQNENVILEEDYIPVLNIPDEDTLTLCHSDLESEILDLDVQPVVYVSGYIAHCVLKIKKCMSCQDSLTTKPGDETNLSYEYIKLREWWKDRSSLTYPSKGLYNCINQCINLFENEVVPVIHTLNIRQLTVTMFMAHTNNSFVMCNEHRSDITHLIMVKLALLLIRRHCAIINKKIAFEEERVADVLKKSEQTLKTQT